MAQIIYLHHEDISRALIESALQTREIGFTGASGYEELILKAESGSYYHFASLERLDDHVASASSGAKLIGFAPPTGMSSTDVQAAIEEILTLTGGGSLVGTGTTGKLVVWASGTTIGNSSILSEATGKLLFSGDAVATLYRSTASTMKTDAAFQSAGLLSALASLAVAGTITIDADVSVRLYRYAASTLGVQAQLFVGDLATFDGNINGNKYLITGINLIWDDSASSLAAGLVRPSLTKNTSNTRTFQVIKALVTLNAGGSNLNTTVNLIEADTVNTSLIGLTVNLLRLAYGGVTRFLIRSDGQVSISGSSQANLKLYGLNDSLNTDSESLEIHHDGSTAYLAVRKSGSGSYRDYQLLNNNSTQYLLTVAGAHAFYGALTIDNAIGGNPFTVKQSGTEFFGVGSGGELRLGGSGTTDALTATLTNSPKTGNPYTWYSVTIPGIGNGWMPVWMP